MSIKDPKKYAYIDALRGWAILGVLMLHCSQHGHNQYIPVLSSIITNGAYGVQLFFIVSALTLFMSMKERVASEQRPFINYFIRRFFRIAPMFYAAIIYYLWQDGFGPRPWVGDGQNITISNIISTFTFTNGFNPYWINCIVNGGWTIAVEMVFYLCLPVLFKNIKNLTTAVLLAMAMALVSTALHVILRKMAIIPQKDIWEWYLYIYFPSQFPVLLLGIVLFYMIRAREDPVSRLGRCYLSICLSVCIMVQMVTKWIFPPHFIFGIALMLFAYALSLHSPRLLVNRFTVFLGKISYSLYLTHFAVLHFMDKFNFVDFSSNPLVNYIGRYSVLLSTAGGISFITYSLVERPGQDLGKKLIKILNKW